MDTPPDASTASSPADGAPVAADANITPPPGRPPYQRAPFYRTCQATVSAVSTLGFRLKAYGVERIPKTGGLLMISNHQSYLDPPLLGAKVPRSMAFLAKSELFHFGPFGWMIRNLNAFPVRQGKGDVGAMKESIRLLQNGWMLNVFPEGGRTPDGELKPAQKGVGLMVRRADVPVLPAVIDGTYQAWPRGRKLPRPRRVRVLYGEPVEIGHLKPDEIRSWIDETFARMLADLRAGRV